jgi:hypothetical protein
VTRQFFALIVSVLSVVSFAVKAQEPVAKKGDLPKSNQVYVKLIWPTAPAARDKDRPVVESWIAEQLKKAGQTKFTAATGVGASGFFSTLSNFGVGCEARRSALGMSRGRTDC